MCASCEVGHSRSSEHACGACPPLWLNITLIVAFVVLMVGVLAGLVYSTLSSAAKEKSMLSVYMKITLNHLQLLVIVSTFELDWPSVIKNMFNSAKPVSSISTQYISLDCLFDT